MILALTPGDPDGIGPEIVWKTLQSKDFRRAAKNSKLKILCVGAESAFRKLGAKVALCDSDASVLTPPQISDPHVWLLPAPKKAPAKKFLPGYQAGWSIEKATALVLSKQADALVTGPISKVRLQDGGFSFPGHTEFLSFLCRDQTHKTGTKAHLPEVTMVLANQYLRVALVTIHIGIKDVAPSLSKKEIKRAVIQMAQGLSRLWGIQRPRIAVAALNPHAGESGRIGKEEVKYIEPTLEELRKELGTRVTLEGPLPADTLFARNHLSVLKTGRGLYDAVVCMYHDQGLIPVKLLDFHRTVNVTLGLPIIRTSVDHGVGFDIAGKGIADASSLGAAIELAAQFVGCLATKS